MSLRLVQKDIPLLAENMLTQAWESQGKVWGLLYEGHVDLALIYAKRALIQTEAVRCVWGGENDSTLR